MGWGEKWPLQNGVIFLSFLESNHQKVMEIFSTCLFPIKGKISATAEFCPSVVPDVVIIMQALFFFFKLGHLIILDFLGQSRTASEKNLLQQFFSSFPLSPSFIILSALWGTQYQWKCKNLYSANSIFNSMTRVSQLGQTNLPLLLWIVCFIASKLWEGSN